MSYQRSIRSRTEEGTADGEAALVQHLQGAINVALKEAGHFVQEAVGLIPAAILHEITIDEQQRSF